MAQDKCTFSYVRLRDCEPVTATGLERTWLDLKIEYGRSGEGLPGAKYYKTISEQGPQLFAVKLDQTVWYHDAGEWHKYNSANSVEYGSYQSSDMNPRRGTTASNTDEDGEPQFGEEDGS